MGKESLAQIKLKRPTESNIQKFKDYNGLYNKVRRAAVRSYYGDKFKEASNDIKASWDMMREILGNKKRKSTIPNYFLSEQGIVRGSGNIANGFNNFFTQIGRELAASVETSERHFTEFLGRPSQVNFVFARLTPENLLLTIRKIRPKHSSGPDKISAKIIKDIFPAIAVPLCYIFNLSLQTGYIPERFKTARVIPIYKSGNQHHFTNYRPISLLSSFSKILEKIVATQVSRYLHVRDILYEHQYSFRKGHNTSHPIVHFLNNIFNANNDTNLNYTMGIFVDLKKAFNKIE